MQNLAGSALFLPQGGTHFQLVLLGSPLPKGISWANFHKHKVFAPNAPSKSDPNYSPLKKLKSLKKKFTFITSNIYIS